MKITDLLPENTIKIGLPAKTKKEVLSIMLQIAANSGNIKNYNNARRQLAEREKLCTTAIGNGIALPHTKSNEIISMAASFAILRNPIPFDAADNKPVNIVLLLLSNENNVGRQLRYLSIFSNFFANSDNIANILNCKTEIEILDILSQCEEE
ncbi:MAG: PTS sugar transporter subunit IIA [Ignavibacteria bacterium]|jgi:mannitol/fructose-specific phosphotransferase system IIA component (Ntr-type)|nr:PTS sugar transporter subunit IIA [Ignavibacteria bacterium]